MEHDFSPFLRFIAKTTYHIDAEVSARDCRILYILSGSGTYEYGGNKIELCPNTLIYYPYGFAYRISSDTKNKLLFYTINFDFSQEYTDMKTMEPVRTSKGQNDDILYSIPDELKNFSEIIVLNNAIWAEDGIEQLYSEYFNREYAYIQNCSAKLKTLLIHIYRQTLRHGQSNPVCREIKDLIRRNLRINIKELGEILTYHPFYLNELFKKNEGISLHKYIVRQRLIKANELICMTAMPLSEIALLCGFSSQSHFSAAFKDAYGITPNTLRRQI